MKNKSARLILGVCFLLLVGAGFLALQFSPGRSGELAFQGGRARQDIRAQLEFGPRYPGSEGHTQTIAYITSELRAAGWQVEQQTLEQDGVTIKNILAHRGNGTPDILLGAHYDTRRYADRQSGPNSTLPVPGANDGASGVAVLLELSRVLPVDLRQNVWLAFFDAEDGGGIEGNEWILGSTAFAESLVHAPEAVVIVDMVGDKDLQIYLEGNSDTALSASIWSQAEKLGYGQFVPQAGYSMLDDHTPFLRAGIPSVLIIDFDYPFWHTTEDTLDKTSAESLEAVGDTLLHWIIDREPIPVP